MTYRILFKYKGEQQSSEKKIHTQKQKKSYSMNVRSDILFFVSTAQNIHSFFRNILHSFDLFIIIFF